MDSYTNPAPGFRDHPEHTITIEPFAGTVVVKFGDVVLGASDNALELKEADYAPIYYIPFKDLYFEFLKPSDTKTRSPFKGDASHWGVTAANVHEDDVMWVYEFPYDEVREIKDHGAFYADKVRIEATPAGGKTRDK